MTEGIREHGRLAGGASTRPATWLAWLLWMVIMISGATLLFPLDLRWNWYVLTHYFYRYPEDFTDVLTSGIVILAVPAYATVGAIIVSLRPRNGVGWLCLALGLISVLVSWQPEYGSMPALANGLAGLAWVLIAPPLAVTLILLIFPDGCLLSRRWRVVVGMALVWPVLGPLGAFYQPYPSVELVRKIGFSISVVALLASVVAIVLASKQRSGASADQVARLRSQCHDHSRASRRRGFVRVGRHTGSTVSPQRDLFRGRLRRHSVGDSRSHRHRHPQVPPL